MALLLYLSCFSYTVTLVVMYHILCKIYLALQLQLYVMFFLSEIKFLYLVSYLVSFIFYHRGFKNAQMILPTEGKTMYTMRFCGNAAGSYMPP